MAGPEAGAAGTRGAEGPGGAVSESSPVGAGTPKCSGTCSPGVQPRVALWVMSAVGSVQKSKWFHVRRSRPNFLCLRFESKSGISSFFKVSAGILERRGLPCRLKQKRAVGLFLAMSYVYSE